MIDIHENTENRGIAIDNVGISEYLKQITINSEPTLAYIDFSVTLAKDKRAIHMSRLSEILNTLSSLSNGSLNAVLTTAIERLETNAASIQIKTNYFINKVAPISKSVGKMNYELSTCSQITENDFIVRHMLSIPITSVCPCSKEISDFGAHNQRGVIGVCIEGIDVIEFNSIINCVEKTASFELFSVLKRPDEKYVTEKAYVNAKFVEDIARDTAIELEKKYKGHIREISVKNFESIHNHNAFSIINF